MFSLFQKCGVKYTVRSYIHVVLHIRILALRGLAPLDYPFISSELDISSRIWSDFS